jgi:hypothetical protein
MGFDLKEIVIKIKPIEYEILKAIGILTLKREEENNVNKKININSYSVAKCCGLDSRTTKKYLKKLKDL